MAQQSTQPRAFVGLHGPQGLALHRQTVAGHENLLGAPVGDHAVAVVVHQDDAPGQMVEGIERGVSLDLQLGQAVLHAQCALEMRQQQAAALDVVAVERRPCPRPHRLEQHRGPVLADEHRAEAVMQILRQQPFGVELGGDQSALGYEVLAQVNPAGWPVISLAIQPYIAISVMGCI
jgi:hypothetical protein